MLEKFVTWCERERDSLRGVRTLLQEGKIMSPREPRNGDDNTRERLADIERRLRELDQLLDAYRGGALKR
jgi:hypothetical protein